MTPDLLHTAMAHAFRDTTLGLIGLFQVYQVDRELALATAEVLGTLFRRHLQNVPPGSRARPPSPMHALVDELDRLLKTSDKGG
jgi:hypothetical protein